MWFAAGTIWSVGRSRRGSTRGLNRWALWCDRNVFPSLLLSLGSASGRSPQVIPRCLAVHCSSFDLQNKFTRARECVAITPRDILGFAFGAPSLFISSFPAKGAGLPPEEKPRLCDDTYEKELENVPMITTESGLQYKDIKVGKGSTPRRHQSDFRFLIYLISSAMGLLSLGNLFDHWVFVIQMHL